MRLSPEQLPAFLDKSDNLPPVFLLSGEEPLQLMEAADAIRAASIKHGFDEREIMHVDTGFSWNSLAVSSNTLSLFSEKKLLDLRLGNNKPGKPGSDAIRGYLSHIPDDKILLIQAEKMDARSRNAAWVKAIDQAGVVTQVWKLSPAQTMGWVARRMRQQGMKPSQDAVHFLTERIEGNLLAAVQEINKLSLLFGQTEIDFKQVQAAVSDSSRFTIFDLSTAIMLGDSNRVQHIMHHLQQEDVPVQLVLWTISDLSRHLYEANFQMRQGVVDRTIVNKQPKPRQQAFSVALKRVKTGMDWDEILLANSEIDRLSKGVGEIDNKGVLRVWAGLLDLALLLSGFRVVNQHKFIA